MAILQALGIVSCLGGPERFCGYAAEMLRDEFARQPSGQTRLQLQWHMLYPQHQGMKEEKIAGLNRSTSRFTESWTKENKPFLVVGGDHSCAMGTWGGVINGLQHPHQLGLVWLDAHMDAHTFLTSPSGNVHGMPVAALLGKADERLAKLYPGSSFIKPENLILIGVRSYEPEEYELLKQAPVEIVFASRMDNLKATLSKAVAKLNRSCQVIGISLDLDAIDPEDAPGVETPCPGGIKAKDLLAALASISRHPKLCGLEISEFNPENDSENKTLRLMRAVVEAFY